MMSIFLAEAEGEHEAVNEWLFEPIWFGVITAVVFLALLAFLWSFRNTLALDTHTEDHEQDSDGGSEHTSGRATQH